MLHNIIKQVIDIYTNSNSIKKKMKSKIILAAILTVILACIAALWAIVGEVLASSHLVFGNAVSLLTISATAAIFVIMLWTGKHHEIAEEIESKSNDLD